MKPLIQLTDLQKLYRLGRVDVRALRDVTLEIEAGELMALAGPSGSGKTTLLNIIGCVDKPTAGRVILDGKDVTDVPLHRLALDRRDAIGYIFQTFNLIPVLTAYENVEFPLLLKGVARKERRAMVTQWLERVGLADKARHRPDQLSGGQRQRVAIARAMVAAPKLVLADEPTANLDSETGAQILDLMQRLNRETGRTFVFATHDPAVMARASRIVSLRDGAIVDEVPRVFPNVLQAVAMGAR
ncbi:MAG: transporter related protein [Acidobacteria bacterium]|nr:transporter related protein [Acidobacteriota bacterium]